MDNSLRCRFLPCPKRGGALATTLPATPTALPIVHLQVLRRERMPFAARVGYTAFRLVASALLARCDTLYSEDLQHGQVFDEQLTVVNPSLDA
jgi:predicted nucleic acid-binding protein